MSEAKLSREQMSRRLRTAPNYWIATTRADGRPHAAPVWGAWLDDRLYFDSGRGSVKGRNLARRPEVVVHLESGNEVVIVEGVAQAVTDAAELSRATAALAAKYAMDWEGMTAGDPQAVLFRVTPRRVLAWLEAMFLESDSRWSFPAGDGRPASTLSATPDQ